MAVSSCPSCKESVTVPPGAPGSARVRCPLCNDEFLLSVVLDKLPPTLVWLDAPAADHSATGLGGISLGPEVGTRPPAFEFDEASAPSGKRAVTSSPRPKPKQKSMIFEGVKIVLGGGVGIGLATIILWWAFHKDPLNLAPTVSAYVPWAVPEKLRARTKDSSDKENDTSTDAGANGKNGGSKVAAKPNGGGKSKNVASSASSKTPSKPEVLQDIPFPATEPKKPVDDPLNIGLDPGIAPKPKATKPGDVKPKSPSGAEAAKPKRFDLAKTLKPQNALELARAVREAEQANADIDAALSPAAADLSNEKKREFSNAYYDAIARLGEVVISVDPNDPQIQNEATKVGALMVEVSKNPAKQRLLAALAEKWLSSTERANGGLCVPGVVKEITPRGALHEIELELLNSKMTRVSVFASQDPTQFYQTEARVLLLGAMIPDPKKNLIGYKGDLPEVGCVHFYVPLMAEAPAEEKPGAEKPTIEKPTSEKPATKPAGEKPPSTESPTPPTKPAPPAKPASADEQESK